MSTQQPKQFRVLLIGDKAVDRYILGEIKRISPEAPVPVLEHHTVIEKVGMALNVEANLKAFGLTVNSIYGTRTSIKTRVVDRKSGYHILRIDQDQISSPVHLDTDVLHLENYDAVVVSDYEKGSISYETYDDIKANFNGPVFVDTKKKDIEKLNSFIVKINEDEHQKLISSTEELIITKGNKGASYKGRDYHCPEVVVEDVCGAGDTFLSALVFNFLNTRDLERAIVYANKAAGIAVQHSGTYVLTKDDIDAIKG